MPDIFQAIVLMVIGGVIVWFAIRENQIVQSQQMSYDSELQWGQVHKLLIGIGVVVLVIGLVSLLLRVLLVIALIAAVIALLVVVWKTNSIIKDWSQYWPKNRR